MILLVKGYGSTLWTRTVNVPTGCAGAVLLRSSTSAEPTRSARTASPAHTHNASPGHRESFNTCTNVTRRSVDCTRAVSPGLRVNSLPRGTPPVDDGVVEQPTAAKRTKADQARKGTKELSDSEACVTHRQPDHTLSASPASTRHYEHKPGRVPGGPGAPMDTKWPRGVRLTREAGLHARSMEPDPPSP